MNPTVTVRRLLAAGVVVQPLLVGVNATFQPDFELSAASILAGAAQNPTAWYVLHMVAALGALLIVPAALGLRAIVGPRGGRLADAGVGVGIVAAALLGVSFAIEASVMRLAATAELDGAGRLALSQAFVDAPEFLGVPLGALTWAVAGVLLASALLVAGEAPRWQAGLYLVGMLATLAATPGSPTGPIAFGVVAIASALLAWRVASGGAGPAPMPAQTLRGPASRHAL